MNESVGTWNGWTEPDREPTPLEKARACPTCGFSPRLKPADGNGRGYHVATCCSHETAPRRTRDEAIREWNGMVSDLEAGYCERWAFTMLKTGNLASAESWMQMAFDERFGALR